MITIIDYGMGNLGSVYNMLKKIGVVSKITSDLEEIKSAKKLLLPGVGSFDKAMERIKTSGIKEVLDQKVLVEEIPILGICLESHSSKSGVGDLSSGNFSIKYFSYSTVPQLLTIFSCANNFPALITIISAAIQYKVLFIIFILQIIVLQSYAKMKSFFGRLIQFSKLC